MEEMNTNETTIETVVTESSNEVVEKKEKKNPYAMFAMDECMEADGIWVDYGLFRVKVARQGGKNTLYSKEALKVSKKHNAASFKRMGNEKAAVILNELYVKGLVKGWEVWDEDKDQWVSGLFDIETGEVVPATFDNMLKTFSHFEELQVDILKQSGNKDNYIKEEVLPN